MQFEVLNLCVINSKSKEVPQTLIRKIVFPFFLLEIGFSSYPIVISQFLYQYRGTTLENLQKKSRAHIQQHTV